LAAINTVSVLKAIFLVFFFFFHIIALLLLDVNYCFAVAKVSKLCGRSR